ncbi:hypothetical protein AYI70_g7735 [Smittium culicis]|uniref:Uncharacterized protein n=1 Tax=Smittium culicis TaxID=133412 RepID=A0A1R1X1M0_9FUNG|nr:hypothetical protein AYI70_g11500 [Smittium culicis]OMJ14678.1 hypothetical protein AYI70_g7735 [Smittium culicis]
MLSLKDKIARKAFDSNRSYLYTENEHETDTDDPNDVMSTQDIQVGKLKEIMKNEDPKQCFFVYDLYKRLDNFANKKNYELIKKYYYQVTKVIAIESEK